MYNYLFIYYTFINIIIIYKVTLSEKSLVYNVVLKISNRGWYDVWVYTLIDLIEIAI